MSVCWIVFWTNERDVTFCRSECVLSASELKLVWILGTVIVFQSEDDEARHNEFGLRLRIAFFVIPFPRLQASLDIDTTAFLEVTCDNLRDLSSSSCRGVLHVLLLLIGVGVLPRAIGGNRESNELVTVWKRLCFRVCGEIPDETDFVEIHDLYSLPQRVID